MQTAISWVLGQIREKVCGSGSIRYPKYLPVTRPGMDTPANLPPWVASPYTRENPWSVLQPWHHQLKNRVSTALMWCYASLFLLLRLVRTTVSSVPINGVCFQSLDPLLFVFETEQSGLVNSFWKRDWDSLCNLWDFPFFSIFVPKHNAHLFMSYLLIMNVNADFFYNLDFVIVRSTDRTQRNCMFYR